MNIEERVSKIESELGIKSNSINMLVKVNKKNIIKRIECLEDEVSFLNFKFEIFTEDKENTEKLILIKEKLEKKINMLKKDPALSNQFNKSIIEERIYDLQRKLEYINKFLIK